MISSLVMTSSVEIIDSGMSVRDENEAISAARTALDVIREDTVEIVRRIGKYFQEAYDGSWHCIVTFGSLGCYVRPVDGYCIYFSVAGMEILLFRSDDT